MEIIAGGVTAARGFEAAAAEAQIKYKDRKDMALVYSQAPCVTAGTFTTNVVKAAPVKWDQEVVYGGEEARAVVINSGIANACTGAEGYGYCKETAAAAARISADPSGVRPGRLRAAPVSMDTRHQAVPARHPAARSRKNTGRIRRIFFSQEAFTV